MKGLKFKLVKEGESMIGYEFVKVLDRFLNTVDEHSHCEHRKTIVYNYVLDCLCPHGYEQIREDELWEELMQGIYVLDQ